VRVALRMEWADGEGRTALLEEVAEVARDRVWTRRAEGPAGGAGVVLVVRVRGR